MSLTRSAVIVISLAIVPTCLAVLWFNLRRLRIKTSLAKTLTTNIIAFGGLLSLIPYSLVFGMAHYLGVASAVTPLRLLLGQDGKWEPAHDQIFRWAVLLAIYYIACFAWFGLVTKWVEWNLRDLSDQRAALRSAFFGKKLSLDALLHAVYRLMLRIPPLNWLNLKAFECFKALDVADPLRVNTWSIGEGNEIEVDIQLRNSRFIYSGVLDDIGPSDNSDTNGLFVSKVLKIPSSMANRPASEYLLKKSPDAPLPWDSRDVLRKMFFPWAAIANVNIRKVKVKKYRVRTTT
jgi:hypothetical protein